jgi:hypothetical protein
LQATLLLANVHQQFYLATNHAANVQINNFDSATMRMPCMIESNNAEQASAEWVCTV